MDCARTSDHLSAYRDGDLPEAERKEVAEHLGHCARCAGEERALGETLSLLKNLPPGKAPPELLEGVRRRIGEKAAVPLWKKLFLPAHIKIPLEAAAVVILFLLVYGIQKEMPSTKSPAPAPAMSEIPRAEPGKGGEAERSATLPPAARRDDTASRQDAAPSRKDGETADAVGQKDVMEEVPAGPPDRKPMEGQRPDLSAPPAEKPGATAKTDLPAVPATRVSTGGGAVGSVVVRDSQEGEAPNPRPRVFAAPPSRLLRPTPYGREVILEAAAEDLPGLADRIAALAESMGGSVRREGFRRAGDPATDPAADRRENSLLSAGSAGEAAPAPGTVRVLLPADAADPFLEELGRLGFIPPEGMPGKIDIPPGPSAGTVAYTVRIRVR